MFQCQVGSSILDQEEKKLSDPLSSGVLAGEREKNNQSASDKPGINFLYKKDVCFFWDLINISNYMTREKQREKE